jgi:hypothetical protein
MTVEEFATMRRSQPVEIKAPRVVRTTPKGKAWRLKELEPDPEADARVAAFFAKMIARR